MGRRQAFFRSTALVTRRWPLEGTLGRLWGGVCTVLVALPGRDHRLGRTQAAQDLSSIQLQAWCATPLVGETKYCRGKARREPCGAP